MDQYQALYFSVLRCQTNTGFYHFDRIGWFISFSFDFYFTSIQKGGSKIVAIEEVKNKISDQKLVGAIGIEAMVALKKLSISNTYVYGVTEAAIEAVKTGLCPVIVCVDDEIPSLTRKLGEEDIDYEIVDVKKV